MLKKILFSGVIALCVLSVQPSTTYAQALPDVKIVKMDPSLIEVRNDFQVTPTRLVSGLEPGTEKIMYFSLINRFKEKKTFQFFKYDFAPDSEANDIRMYEGVAGPYSAKSWIETPTEISLNYAERAMIPVRISVPQNASVGDHYTSVIVRLKENIDKPGFGIISQIGVLMVLTANGDVVKKGDLISFASRYPLYWSRHAAFSLKYRNEGTVHLIPTGVVKIKNMFGVTVDQIDVKDWYVYRESVRSRVLDWKPRFAFGRYSATIELSDAAHKEPLMMSTSFWILPIIPVLIILSVILLLSLISQIILSRYDIKKKGV